MPRSVSPAPGCDAESVRKTILVVDDHEIVREMFAVFLRSLGYKVLEAPGPLEAQAMAAGPAKFDLLLTDFRMPQMNGIQLARWFREACPRSKVLVVSTTPWEVEPYLSKSDGFALLEKSEAFSRLAGVVNELLGQSTLAPSSGPLPAVSSRQGR